MKIKSSLIMLLSLLFLTSAQTFSSISEKSLKEKIDFLTSKELEGRLPGTDGYNKAAYYAASKLEGANILPFGDSSYYQFRNVESNLIREPIEFSLINLDQKIKFELGKDFIFRGFTGSGDIEEDVVFCGYGISRPDLGYDDYANIDVKNKIVMVFKYNPSWNINDSLWGTNYPREKSWTAYQKGAKGIIFISFPNDKSPQAPIGSVLHGNGKQLTNFPQLHASLLSAEKFFANSEYNLNKVQSIIDSVKSPLSFDLNLKARVKVTSQYEEKSRTMNIVGLIKGNDEILKNEYIIIGAHIDHVGQQGDSIYFPGANDNASGSASVLAIAEEIASLDNKPKRSIIFILFASEEQGLFGAKHFSENLPISNENIVAMINMDCVGFGDSIQIGNGESAPQLWDIAKNLDSKNDNLMVEKTWSGGGADATPFHKIGIPSLYFVTTNSYEHLHKLSDKSETLNYSLFNKLTKLAFQTVMKIAEGKYQRETVN